MGLGDGTNGLASEPSLPCTSWAPPTNASRAASATLADRATLATSNQNIPTLKRRGVVVVRGKHYIQAILHWFQSQWHNPQDVSI